MLNNVAPLNKQVPHLMWTRMPYPWIFPWKQPLKLISFGKECDLCISNLSIITWDYYWTVYINLHFLHSKDNFTIFSCALHYISIMNLHIRSGKENKRLRADTLYPLVSIQAGRPRSFITVSWHLMDVPAMPTHPSPPPAPTSTPIHSVSTILTVHILQSITDLWRRAFVCDQYFPER